MTEQVIIYEDASLLLISKRNGVSVEPDQYGNASVHQEIADYFSAKRVSQNTIIGITHRIDRPVSGILLVAKKRSVLKELNKQFELQQIDKTYFALVENAPLKPEGILQHYLRKDPKEKKAFIYKNKQHHSVKCELFYKALESGNGSQLLEVHPLTGKYHQIRAQLAFIGCPIIGDEKYGSKKKYKKEAICLHASAIEFYHPVERKKMKFTTPLPSDWPVN